MKLKKLLKKMREKFKQEYGKELYDKIESESGLVGARVKLPDKYYCGEGTVIGLWLPANPEDGVKRKYNLWYVKWDKGTNGIVDENELIKI